jgi:cytochrome oxidase Cu insertion factor (SCO1/SenC/PrrC family)
VISGALLAMTMSRGPNLPAEYLDARLTHVAEAGLLGAFVLAGSLWWLGKGRRASLRGSAGTEAGASRAWWQVFEAGPPSRAALEVGFGALWLLDGMLQAQASMPRDFAAMVLAPALAGQPPFVLHLGRIGIDLWGTHTVATDAFTVFVQVAIGLGMLLGGESALGRAALVASIAWGLVVWLLGEGLGGVFGHGATLLAGAPGAALAYVAAALVLVVVPAVRYDEARVGRRVLAGLGAVWLLAALVQAVPFEGFWSGDRLAKVFGGAASNPQPAPLSAPIAALARAAAQAPAVANGLVVGLFALLGCSLLATALRAAPGRRGSRFAAGAVAASAVGLLAVWWLGEDFGVVGGTGTDPNLALALGVFLASGWLGVRRPGHPPGAAPATAVAVLEGPPRPEGSRFRLPELVRRPARFPHQGSWSLRHPLRTWLLAAAGAAAAWSGLPVLGSLPAAAATPFSVGLALAGSGGLASVPGHPRAPGFVLVDQAGRRTELSDFRGRTVVLSFLDPACARSARSARTRSCPAEAAATSDAMAKVATLLARRAAEVAFVVVDADPAIDSPAALRAFDADHGVSRLRDWTYLTGPRATLEQVYAAYGAASLGASREAPVGTAPVYLIGPCGHEQAVTEPPRALGASVGRAFGARAFGARGYAAMLAEQASRLTPHAFACRPARLLGTSSEGGPGPGALPSRLVRRAGARRGRS